MINNNNKKVNLRTKEKRGKTMIAILLLIAIIGVGYAALGANLKINGVANIPSASWDVHFKTGSINVTSGSVSIDTENNEQAATITNATQVDYAVKLALPGDFYEFTVTAENTGSIDAMIDSVVSKRGDTVITTGTLPSYIDYSVTYSDGIEIQPHHLLAASTEETYKVRIEFKKDIEASELPQTVETLNLNFQINYVQADDTAIERPVPSFADDSWETIISNVQNNTIPSYYTVGSTKEVDLGSLGTHTLRVVNTSTPSECGAEGFSQTACGFVLEFVDSITTHRMNPYTNGSTNGTGNIGGWEYSEMRTYVNTDIYNALPTSLKNAIINTTVVSGHGSNDTTNFTTVDKLYLLDAKEIYGESFTISYNTAKEYERQLDYYKSQNVTYNGSSCSTCNYAAAIKQNNGSNFYWWLRSAYSSSNSYFFNVNDNGYCNSNSSSTIRGLAPAFRLG